MSIRYQVQEQGENVYFQTVADLVSTTDGDLQSDLDSIKQILPEVYVGTDEPTVKTPKIWIDPSIGTLETFYNKNLLINSNFLSPVNQRGFTTYANNQYTIDRWYYTNGTISNFTILEGEGVSFTGDLVQYIEIDNSIIGKPVSLSAYANNFDVVLAWENIIVSTELQENTNFGLQYNETLQALMFVLHSVNTTFQATFQAVKLELGTHVTDYVPEKVSTEVVNCLRYYYKVQQNNTDCNYALGVSNSNYLVYFPYKFPVFMRIVPTFSFGGNFRCYGGGATIPSFNLSKIEYSPAAPPQLMYNGVMTVTLMGTRENLSQPTGQIYSLNGTTANSYIAFDAEYYV